MTELRLPGRRRFLSDQEIDLWLEVTRGVALLPGRTLPSKPQPKQAVSLPPAPADAPVRAKPAPRAARPATPAPPPLAPLDRRQRSRIARGRVEIEAAIDLHGLRQDEAHLALLAFLRRSQSDGERLVLVVTGKGRTVAPGSFGATGETGVLRRSVPHWLRAPDLRRIVLGFEEAAAPHGGMGALYVRLRRSDRGSW